MLQSGEIDCNRFTAHTNAYLTSTALADLRDSLRPLGEPKAFTQADAGVRGGFTVERFILDFGSRKLQLQFSMLAEPKSGGRIEEAMVSPID